MSQCEVNIGWTVRESGLSWVPTEECTLLREDSGYVLLFLLSGLAWQVLSDTPNELALRSSAEYKIICTRKSIKAPKGIIPICLHIHQKLIKNM